jgi:hypothetical protein
MKDENLTLEELEAFEEREKELITDEQSISDEIEKLGLNKMSRESLEYIAASWHLKLRNLEEDFQRGIPSWNQVLELKPYIYKRNKRLGNPKNILNLQSRFKGKFSLAEISGSLSEIENEKDKRRRGGKNRAANDDVTKALDAIEEEYKLKPKGFFELAERLNKFITDMHAQHPIISNRDSIRNRLSKLKNKS